MENNAEEKEKFEKTYPYFMRRVSLALWEKSDPYYREHKTLFGDYKIITRLTKREGVGDEGGM